MAHPRRRPADPLGSVARVSRTRPKGLVEKVHFGGEFIHVIPANLPAVNGGGSRAGIHLVLQRVRWTPAFIGQPMADLFAGVTFAMVRNELKGFSTSPQAVLYRLDWQ